MSQLNSNMDINSIKGNYPLIIGLVAIVALTIYLGFYFLVKDYGVLYSDLSEEEAATVVEGLKELKVDYKIGQNGQSILVPKDSLNETKLNLLSTGITMDKTVGLEIFNNSDYGMTEFAQKVNFQRAMQGELARTIMSLKEIKFARVHLTLPQESLFADQQKPAKASITLIKEDGEALSTEQIYGIQRLAASSVEELSLENVVVVDEQGIDISTKQVSQESAQQGFIGQTMLDKKKEYEQHLQEKIESLLTQGLGSEQFAISVDVQFDLAKTSSLTENLLTPGNSKNGFLKKTQVNVKYDDANPNAEVASKSTKQSEQTSDEYLYGKEVKQTEYLGGDIKNISVAVILPDSIPETQVTSVEKIVSAAAGINAERGDLVQVHRLPFAKQQPQAAVAQPSTIAAPIEQPVIEPSIENSTVQNSAATSFTAVLSNMDKQTKMIALGAIGFVIVVLMALGFAKRRKKALQREQVLNDVKGWLAELGTESNLNHELAAAKQNG